MIPAPTIPTFGIGAIVIIILLFACAILVLGLFLVHATKEASTDGN